MPTPTPRTYTQRYSTRYDTRKQPQRRPAASWPDTLRLLLRLGVTGVGVAILAGTLLHRYRPSTGNLTADNHGSASQDANTGNHGSEAQVVGWIATSLGAGDRLQGLEERFQALAASQPDLRVGAYVAILGGGQHASLNPDRPLAAASAIKPRPPPHPAGQGQR